MMRRTIHSLIASIALFGTTTLSSAQDSDQSTTVHTNDTTIKKSLDSTNENKTVISDNLKDVFVDNTLWSHSNDMDHIWSHNPFIIKSQSSKIVPQWKAHIFKKNIQKPLYNILSEVVYKDEKIEPWFGVWFEVWWNGIEIISTSLDHLALEVWFTQRIYKRHHGDIMVKLVEQVGFQWDHQWSWNQAKNILPEIGVWFLTTKWFKKERLKHIELELSTKILCENLLKKSVFIPTIGLGVIYLFGHKDHGDKDNSDLHNNHQ